MDKKSRESLLTKILAIIRKKPGIRPSELNRRLNLAHSWNLRSILIKKELIRKKKEGNAMRYYPKTPQ